MALAPSKVNLPSTSPLPTGGAGFSGAVPVTQSDILEVHNLLKKTADKFEKQVKKVEDKHQARLDEYDLKAEERQIKSIEALGIFVALFSYISVTIQIFSRVSSAWNAGLFMFLIFCGLALMVILMDILLIKPPRTSANVFKDYRLGLIVLFLLVAAVCLYVLRNMALSPIQGSVDFEKSLDVRIDEKIDLIIENKIDKMKKDGFFIKVER